jgi:hypothetical protein
MENFVGNYHLVKVIIQYEDELDHYVRNRMVLLIDTIE